MHKVVVDYARDEKIQEVLAQLQKHGGTIGPFLPVGSAAGNSSIVICFDRQEAAVAYLRERHPDDSLSFCIDRIISGPAKPDSLTLSAEENSVLKTILEFHASNDSPGEYYPEVPFASLCGKLGVEVPE